MEMENKAPEAKPVTPKKTEMSLASSFSTFKPSLNINSGTFVPSVKPQIDFSP